MASVTGDRSRFTERAWLAEADVPQRLVDLALAVGESATLDQVLALAVQTARELLGAGRACVLLLDAGALWPAVAVARTSDQELWTRFRAMRPLTVATAATALLHGGKAVVVEDAAGCDFVSEDWRAAFGLTALVVVPLGVHGEPNGVLVVDQLDQSVPVSPRCLHLLEAIAALVATAVGRDGAPAALRHAADRDTLVGLGAALNATAELTAVLDVVTRTLFDVLHLCSCLIAQVDGQGGLEVLASRGRPQVAPGSYPPAHLPAALRDWLGANGARQIHAPVLCDLSADSSIIGQWGPFVEGAPVLFVPFVEADLLRGVALVRPRVATDVTAGDLALARLVADQAWLGISRAISTRRTQLQLDAVCALLGLGEMMGQAGGLNLALDYLAPWLRQTLGLEPLSLVLAGAHADQALQTNRPRGELADQLRRWQRGKCKGPIQLGGRLVAPLLLDGELVGALEARPVAPRTLAAPDLDFLRVLTGGLAAEVERMSLRRGILGAQTDLADARESGRAMRETQLRVAVALEQAAASLGGLCETQLDAVGRATL
ncbi:MAG: GAF domain-containing protein, partial [Mycobacteriales bacterium]